MGVSTDGILFFGVHYEEEELDLGNDEDWSYIVARKLGWKEPDEPYPKVPNYGPDRREATPEEQAVIDKYHAAWDAKRDLLKRELPDAEIDIHCSYDCPMPYISVGRLRFLNSRGYPVEVPCPLPTPTEEEVAAMKKLADLVGLPWREPKWWLVSLWG